MTRQKYDVECHVQWSCVHGADAVTDMDCSFPYQPCVSTGSVVDSLLPLSPTYQNDLTAHGDKQLFFHKRERV